MRARNARVSDATAVHRLIAHYAGEGLLLPRTEAEIRKHIGRFLVLMDKRNGEEKFLGCVALEPYGADLAEIRSLAVIPEERGAGHGAADRLMKAALDTAKRRKIARLFALTHRPDLFSRYGFAAGPRDTVTEKIARDCQGCPKEHRCKLIACTLVVCPERQLLSILPQSVKSPCAAEEAEETALTLA